jgi:hypothetical protein
MCDAHLFMPKNFSSSYTERCGLTALSHIQITINCGHAISFLLLLLLLLPLLLLLLPLLMPRQRVRVDENTN